MGVIFSKTFIIIVIIIVIIAYTPDKYLQKIPPIWNLKLFVKNTSFKISSAASNMVSFLKKTFSEDTKTLLKGNEDLFQGFKQK